MSNTPSKPATLAAEEIREQIVSVLREAAYCCTRVWTAWSHGTMTEADFHPAWEDDDVVDELVAIIDRHAPQSSEDYKPLHPSRLQHPLEAHLRNAWETMSARNQDLILAGPECAYEEIPVGTLYDSNQLTGGYQPFPYGKMTPRDRMVAGEVIQWLGTGVGYNLLVRAFNHAGGKVEFDDYKMRSQEPEVHDRHARVGEAEEIIKKLVDSAYPNPLENPSMYAAWTEARAFLAANKGETEQGI